MELLWIYRKETDQNMAWGVLIAGRMQSRMHLRPQRLKVLNAGEVLRMALVHSTTPN
jgi:hypothetical protein